MSLPGRAAALIVDRGAHEIEVPVAAMGCGSAGIPVTHEDASNECAHTGS